MENNTPKKILLINDMPGYGKVALAAMMPILSNMKYEVHDLPTALVSNTLDYGKFEILENHAPIISALAAGDIRIMTPDNAEQIFAIRGGVIKGQRNELLVLVQ